MKHTFFLVAGLLIVGCGSPTSPPLPPPPVTIEPDVVAPTGDIKANSEPKPEDYNAIAFREANRASAAALEYNWTTANRILSRIDASRITDTDVDFYVDYCTRTATVAERLGVDNESNPDSIYNTVENLDLTALAATLVSIYEQEGFTGGAKLAADAKRVRDEMSMWHEANRKLITRYGLK